MNNKFLTLLLCLVLAAALLLAGGLFLHYRVLGSRLQDLQAQVNASIDAWKATDAEKQVLFVLLGQEVLLQHFPGKIHAFPV